MTPTDIRKKIILATIRVVKAQRTGRGLFAAIVERTYWLVKLEQAIDKTCQLG